MFSLVALALILWLVFQLAPVALSCVLFGVVFVGSRVSSLRQRHPNLRYAFGGALLLLLVVVLTALNYR